MKHIFDFVEIKLERKCNFSLISETVILFQRFQNKEGKMADGIEGRPSPSCIDEFEEEALDPRIQVY